MNTMTLFAVILVVLIGNVLWGLAIVKFLLWTAEYHTRHKDDE